MWLIDLSVIIRHFNIIHLLNLSNKASKTVLVYKYKDMGWPFIYMWLHVVSVMRKGK